MFPWQTICCFKVITYALGNWITRVTGVAKKKKKSPASRRE